MHKHAQMYAGADIDRRHICDADEEPFGPERRTCRPESPEIHYDLNRDPCIILPEHSD